MLRVSDVCKSQHTFRDAWNSVKGTSKEKAHEEYVKCFTEVSSLTLFLDRGVDCEYQVFKKADSEDAKKHIAEVEGA
jgi:hypothetical protein